MKRTLSVSVGLLFIILTVVACGAEAPADVTRDGPVQDYATLVDKLRAKGTTVESTDVISQPFFTASAQVIQVNGQSIQVFEYADAAVAKTEAELVSADGSSVGTTMVGWVEAPHFFQSGRLIVLYVGDDPTTLNLLDEILGSQFAGH